MFLVAQFANTVFVCFFFLNKSAMSTRFLVGREYLVAAKRVGGKRSSKISEK